MLKKIRIIILTLFVLGVVCSSSFAQNFSRIRDLDTGQQVIDLVVSLHDEPYEDMRQEYERALGYFADGLYESTNGKHMLGTVRIFINDGQSDIADIIWGGTASHDQYGMAYATQQGFGDTDGKIWIFDSYYITEDGERILEFPSTKELGYALTHEAGHYIYGVLDEYADPYRTSASDPGFALASDTPAVPSIMNSDRDALAGNYAWLNFSTKASFQLNTGQGRVWGISQWDLLVQDPANDRLHGDASAQVERTLYPVLREVAPAITDTYTFGSDTYTYMKVELSDANPNIARQHFNPVWMEAEVEIELILDKSGSMRGADMENVKTASELLLDFITPGNTAIGVVAFSNSISDIQPVVAIPEFDTTIIPSIKNKIRGISAGGSTAIYDAAIAGLNALNYYTNTNGTTYATRFGLLLSDGYDNASSNNLATVKQAYNDSNVPLYTIHYGNAGGRQTLLDLATETKGAFYDGVNTALELWPIFRDIYAAAADFVTITTSGPPLDPAPLAAPAPNNTASTGGSENDFDIVVDSTLSSLQLTFTYKQLSGTTDFTILDAEGGAVAYSRDDLTDVSNNKVTILKVDPVEMEAHTTGTWSIQINSTGSIEEMTHDVKAETTGATYELIANSLSGTDMVYPEPVLLAVRLIKRESITGYNLTGTIKTPSGNLIPITLNDDGVDGDHIENDGRYSAIFSSYSENGRYTFTAACDNSNGNAVLATNFYGTKGSAAGDVPPIAITENFQRSITLSFTINGVGQPQPDTIIANNVTVNGKIDNSGDVNEYTIIDIDKTEPLFVRVSSLGKGIIPVLTVYGDGAQIAAANLFTNVSEHGYVVAEIAPEILEHYSTFTATVQNFVSEQEGGIYKISAGPRIIGDELRPCQGIFKVETKDHHLGDPAIAVLSTKIENVSSFDFQDVSLYYYFTADNGATPVITDFYTPNSNVYLESINTETGEYALVFNYGTIPAGTLLPAGLENQVHLRHENYEPMDKSNDYSNNQPMPLADPWPFTVLFAENDKVAVYGTISGTRLLLHGSTPE